jgi:hypothetical protein
MLSQELQTRSATLFLFDCVRLLGIVETKGLATLHFEHLMFFLARQSQLPPPFDVALLRLLTPLVKLFTGKQAVAVASEGIEVSIFTLCA